MEKDMKFPFYAKAALMITGIYLLISMMYMARGVLVPVIFATLIAIVLHPLENYLLRLRLNRILAISITLAVAIIIITGLGIFIILQISRFTNTLPELVAKFNEYITEAIFWVSGFFEVNTQRISDWITITKENIMNKSAPAIGQTLLTLGNLFILLLLIPVYIFMILYYEPILIEFIRRSFGPGYRQKVSQVISEVKNLVQGYISGLFVELVLVAVMNISALLLLGIEYALLLGLLGALLNIIPYIGGIIAVSLPMIIALVTEESPWMVVWVLVAYNVIQFIDNNYIVPKIVASKVKLNALVSIFFVLAFGALWGIPGMFISIPLTAIIKLLADHIEPLKPFGFLLGDTMPEDNGLLKSVIKKENHKKANPKIPEDQ
jgi:predicted PurR-regulated permease PerM